MNSSPSEDFREFVVGRQRALQRMAWLLTGDWAAAEDVVQTALVRAWPHWARVSATGGGEAYVRRIVVNKAIDWRRRRSAVEVPRSVLPDSARLDEPDADLQRLVIAAVLGLPPRQRAVIVLRYFDDLTEVQTAAAMSCSVGTVKSQASKALASLRQTPELADLELEESTP